MPNWTDMQKKALQESGNLLVSASAGSGKTSVMAQKVTNYLLSSPEADVAKLIVITFTKAGAEELKSKLTDNLYEELRKTADEAVRQRIRKQLAGIPVSYITTIDGFCLAIVKKHFELIGKDPAVTVMDEGEARMYFVRAREEVIEKELTEEDQAFLELAGMFTSSRDIGRLRETVDYMHAFLAAHEDGDLFAKDAKKLLDQPFGESDTVSYLVGHYKNKAKELAALCDKRLTLLNSLPPSKAISRFFEALANRRDILLDIANAAHAQAMFALAASIVIAPAPRMPKDDGSEEYAALCAAKEIISGAGDFISEVKETFGGSFEEAGAKDEAARKAAQSLLNLTLRVDEVYAEIKARERKADFADIERDALKILSFPAAAEELKNGTDYIFVDEYQDTNYLQEAILSRIARDNLFMVGDVKQSIYKFRFAEPKIFLDKSARFEEAGGGQNIPFRENFRSSRGIVGFVNAVFNEVMTPSFGKLDYRGSAQLVPGLEDAPKKNDFPDIEIAELPPAARTAASYPPVYSVREGARTGGKVSAEGVYIADRIAAMVGRALIYDAKTKTYRLCRYADIAVLTRNKAAADITAELKRRGIPFKAEDFRGETDTSYTDLLVAFAKVLDNPRQDIPLAAVMRSFLGKFTDAELLEIRSKAKNCWFWESVNAYQGDPKTENKIIALRRLIERYRRLAAFVDMRELFDRLIAETGYDGYLLSRDDVNAIRRVNAFIYALSGTRGGASLTDFIACLGTQKELSFAPVEEDCVTFMSVHGSKGLEFPVVFLAKTNVHMKSECKSGMVYMDNRLGIAVRHVEDGTDYKSDTLSTRALALKTSLESKEELVRLFYVATTRAKRHLFITAEPVRKDYLTPDMPQSFAGWLKYAASVNPALKSYYFTPPESGARIENECAAYLPKEAPPVALSREYPFAASADLRCKYSVSTLNKRREPVTEEGASPAEVIDFDREKGEDRIALGIAYHTVLQHADFSRADAEELISELLRDGRLPVLPEGFDTGVISKALNNPVFLGLRGNIWYREQPFMLYVPADLVLDTQSKERVLVQGVIDFFAVGKENVLIDYKFTGASRETAVERYRKQLGIYTLAAEKALGIRVDRRAIYLIGRDEFVWL